MVNRILVFLLCMAVFNLLYEAIRLVNCFRREKRYESGLVRRLFTWGSLSYIIMMAVIGF